MQFTPVKPTLPGKYLWRLPESEKPGYYTLRVEIMPTGEIITDEGDEITTLAKAEGGEWCRSWKGYRAPRAA